MSAPAPAPSSAAAAAAAAPAEVPAAAVASAAPSSPSSSAAEPVVAPAPVAVFTAPPQLFASPFLSCRSDERALARLLSQIHPDYSLYRTTMVLLQRMCDRLAHYMLHRAYHGLNDADSVKSKLRHAEGADAEKELAPPEPVDPHSIHFALPAALHPFTAEIRSHTRETRYTIVLPQMEQIGGSRVQERLAELNAEAPVGFVLPLVCADRWIQDFTMGLRTQDADATLPAVIQSVPERAVLCALVEYFMAEVLELAGNAAAGAGRSVIQVHDVWLAIEGDEELAMILAQFLPVSWSMLPETADKLQVQTPMQFACASRPTDSDSRHTHFLEAAFTSHTAAQASVNRTSWYMSDEAVVEAARLQVSGALRTAEWDRRCRAAHIRPLRFIGVTPGGDGEDPEVASTLVELTDANGHTFELMVRGAATTVHARSSCDLVFMPRPPTTFGSTPPSMLVASVQFDWRLASADAQAQVQAEPGKITMHQWTISQQIGTPHRTNYEPHAQQDEPPIPALALQIAAAAPACISPAQSALMADMWRVVAAASGLLRFSLVGPTLFVHNQPLHARRLFTAHVVDEALLQSGLAPLPFVLSQLISEFHAFDLPYREDAAATQMAAFGFARQMPSIGAAVYIGQLDSGVERCRDDERAFTTCWPIEEPESDDEDGEDDDGGEDSPNEEQEED